jgi:hypothetical protein
MRNLDLHARALRNGAATMLAALALLCTSAAQAHRDPFVLLPVDGAAHGVFPTAISGNSVITGNYVDGGNVNHGFFGPADGTMTSFDAPDASQTAYAGTTPTAINASGVITGIYNNGSMHGFVRDALGNITEFDAISPPSNTTPKAINNKGEIVGQAGYNGFLRKANGKIVSFGVADAEHTSATAINSSGTIAGYYEDSFGNTHGFSRAKDGDITTFDVPGGFDNVYVAGIDIAGNIAGYAWNNSAYVGFVYNAASQSASVFFVSGCPQTLVSGMNYAGAIVGQCYSTGDYTYHGYTRTPDGTITEYDGPNAGSFGAGTFPTAISANGKSVGYTEDNTGAYSGYRLEKPRPQ